MLWLPTESTPSTVKMKWKLAFLWQMFSDVCVIFPFCYEDFHTRRQKNKSTDLQWNCRSRIRDYFYKINRILNRSSYRSTTFQQCCISKFKKCILLTFNSSNCTYWGWGKYVAVPNFVWNEKHLSDLLNKVSVSIAVKNVLVCITHYLKLLDFEWHNTQHYYCIFFCKCLAKHIWCSKI